MIATLTLLAAVSGATPFLSAGTYRYTAAIGGQAAGSSSLVVAHRGAATRIDEKADGSMDGMQYSGDAMLQLGANLAPTQYDGNYEIAGQQATGDGSHDADVGDGRFVGGRRFARQLTLSPNEAHFVVIEPGLLAGLFALPAQMKAWDDPTVLALEPAYARGEALSPLVSDAAQRPANVPAGDVALSMGGKYPFTIWYDPATFVPDEILVPSQNATVTRVRE